MKKKGFLFAFLMSLLLAMIALPTAASANTTIGMDKAKVKMEEAFRFDGMSMRLSCDKSGIRSQWSIDQGAVTELENAGYTVAYGAIMGIGAMDGSVIRTDATDIGIQPDESTAMLWTAKMPPSWLCMRRVLLPMPGICTRASAEASASLPIRPFTVTAMKQSPFMI